MIDTNDIIDDDLAGKPKPVLYSKSVVLWFSFLFSPFIGGILMLINMIRVNRSALGISIFLACLIYSLVEVYIGFLIPYRATGRLVVLILNLAGANILSSPIWKRFIGEMAYDRANPWIAFAIVLVTYFLIAFASWRMLAYFLL